jgi:diaminopimelate decarboxylase
MDDLKMSARSVGPEHIGGIVRRPGPPWPEEAEFGAQGLLIGGVSAEALAERYGTPLFVVDEDELLARSRMIASLFPKAFYAVKAFTAHAVLRIATDAGMDLLAATGGEAEACLRAGVAPSRVVLHGNNKSDDELELAVRARLGLVIADGLDELTRLSGVGQAAGIRQRALLRVVPGIAVETHEAIATGHDGTKFGTSSADVPATVRAAAHLPGIQLVGLHAHLGSQILDIEPYLLELDVLVGLLDELRRDLAAEILDVGGGFGISYTDERGLPLAEAASAMIERLGVRCAAAGLPVPTLAVEPGRALVGPAGVTLYRVGGRKSTADTSIVAVDGGMSDNIRPMLYGAAYTVAFAGPPRPGPSERYTVVGRHCETGDTLATGATLPTDIERRDLVAFAATGAYTYSLASAYNRVGRPAVVAVRDGVSREWLRREDAGDLDRLETAAHRWDPDAPTPPGVTIRPARPRDARSFIAFWRAIVAEGRYIRSERVAHPVRVYRRRFRQPWHDRSAQIVAIRDEEVVGHLYIQREGHPVTRHVATLGISVASTERGKGVGTALMAESIRWARSVGVEKIVLSVYPHNAGAVALYRKFGFVDEGRLQRHSRKSSGYEDEILMATWIGGEGS